MQEKIRVRALKFNPHTAAVVKPRQRSKVDRAIRSIWTVKEKPEHIRLLEIERASLKAEITHITVRSLHKESSNASVLIAVRLRKIASITQKLESRKSPAR